MLIKYEFSRKDKMLFCNTTLNYDFLYTTTIKSVWSFTFQSVEFRHLKLMVVGFGGRGKSTLVRALMKVRQPEKSVPTVGVLVRDWRWANSHLLKFGSLSYLFKMLRSIPVLKRYVNLHLHELDNVYDISEFKSL